MVPREALADVTWVSQNQSYGGFVYPYSYTDEGRYAAMAEVVGLDWDSMSSTTKQHIREETELKAILDNGSCLWNIAYGATYGERPDIVEFLDDLLIQNLFGGSTVYAFALTASDYQYIKDTYEYWSQPRNENTVVTEGKKYTIYVKANYTQYTGTLEQGNVGTPCYYNFNGTSYALVEGGGNTNSKVPQEATFTFTIYNNALTADVLKNYDVLVYGRAGGLSNSRPNNRPGGNLYLLPKEHYTITSEYVTQTRVNLGTFAYTKYTISLDSSYYWQELTANALTSYEQLSNITYDSPNMVNLTNKTITLGDWRGYYIGGDMFNDIYTPTPDPPYVPPELPSPTPTDEPSEPGGGIDIHLPDISFPDITIEDTDGDYTLWLRRIYRAIKTLNQDVQRIGNQLTDGVNTIIAALNDIVLDMDNHCVHIRAEIRRESNSLQIFMRSLVNWLEAMLTNDLNAMEVSITSWLRRIYSRMRNNPSSRPSVDDDGEGFWDWFTRQISEFIGGLFGGALDELGDILGELKEFFPFSIPWDIYALLALFAHEPVIPVFDLPFGVPPQISETGYITIHCDMTSWDGVARAIRGVELIAFAFGLARMVPEWFNTIKVSEGW